MSTHTLWHRFRAQASRAAVKAARATVWWLQRVSLTWEVEELLQACKEAEAVLRRVRPWINNSPLPLEFLNHADDVTLKLQKLRENLDGK